MSGPTQVEPAVTIAGVIRNKVHDELQTWWEQGHNNPNMLLN